MKNMQHFIHMFSIWFLSLLTTTICTDSSATIYYESYHFNLYNLSAWTINEYKNNEEIYLLSCTINIPHLCISTIPTINGYHISYKNVTLDFLNNAPSLLPDHNTSKALTITTDSTRRRLRRRGGRRRGRRWRRWRRRRRRRRRSRKRRRSRRRRRKRSRRSRKRRRSGRCPNILYQQRGRVRPNKKRLIKRINFEDNMIIKLDVTVNSFPRRTWGNIFHCGSSDRIRQPGIWINRHSKRFHISYSTRRNSNPARNSRFKIRRGRRYKIMFKIRRNRYDVYINGRRWYSVNGRHHNHRNQPCWLSNPWYEAANVYVQNLKIIRGTDPNGGCPKKRSPKPKRRRKKRRVRRRRKVRRRRPRPKRRRRRRKTRKRRRRRAERVSPLIKNVLQEIRRTKNKIRKEFYRMGYIMGNKLNGPAAGRLKGNRALIGGVQRIRGLRGRLGVAGIGGLGSLISRRRLMNGYDEDDNDRRLKKCVLVDDGMNELCVVYGYMDESIELEYNVMLNGYIDDRESVGYIEENVWILDDSIGCNDGLVSFMEYIICIEKDDEDGMELLVKESIDDEKGLIVLKKMDLRRDEEWDKIYKVMNGMESNNNNNNKRMCKYIKMINICIQMISHNQKIQIIIQNVVDQHHLEETVNQYIVNE